MKKQNIFHGVFGTLFSLSITLHAQVVWDYSGDNGPEFWPYLSNLYLGCAEGNQQSPINIISRNVASGATDFTLKYSVAKGVNLILENHTFKITYPQGNFLELGTSRYQLKEIYFKTPSENSIDSNQELIEAQLLHEDTKGNKVILSVLFAEGRANPLLDRLIRNLPTNANQSHFIANIDLNQILPKNLASYQFDGSLTRPPCTQGVRWIVLKEPMHATQSQMDAMQNITRMNARGHQDIANRLIVQ